MTDVDALAERLTALSAEKDELSQLLRDSANRVEEGELVRSDALASAVVGYRNRFLQLSDAAGLGGEVSASESMNLSLDAVDTRVSQLAVAGAAKSVLEQIRSLRRSDQSTSPALESLRVAAAELSTRLDDHTGITNADLAEASRLANEQHIFNRVIALVSKASELPDDVWNTYVTEIRDRFGSEMATAIIRGRIRINTSEATN